MNNDITKTNKNAVATKQQKPISPVNNLINVVNKMGSEMEKILPKFLTPERMMRVTVSQIRKTPKLAECSIDSVLSCIMELARVGLEPDGRNAHLIPYNKSVKNPNGSWDKIMECQLQIDYKGIVQLAFNSGKIATIHAEKVCENDLFIYNRGIVEKHRPKFNDRGKIILFYCYVKFKDGTEKFEVMDISEIEEIRARSKSPNKGPWHTDYGEMGKKTVFRRLSKWLPLNAETIDAIQLYDGEFINQVAEKINQKAMIQPMPENMLIGNEVINTQTGEVKEADHFDNISAEEEQKLINGEA